MEEMEKWKIFLRGKGNSCTLLQLIIPPILTEGKTFGMDLTFRKLGLIEGWAGEGGPICNLNHFWGTKHDAKLA